MRMTMRFMAVLLAVVAAGCSSDGSTGLAGLTPPAALSRAVAVEPLITGQVGTPLPGAPRDQLSIRLTVRNGLNETITGGTCAEAIDARAVNGDRWYDVTAASQICSLLALGLLPGASAELTVGVDQAKLRTVAGGVGRPVIVRIRTIFTGENRSYAMTSADQQMTAP
jgi:hypothetical protein